MDDFGKSYKPTFLDPGFQRRRRRGSDASQASSPGSHDAPFAFSVDNSPATENPSLVARSIAPTTRDGLLFGREVNNTSSLDKSRLSTSSVSATSQPIKITEAARKQSGRSAPTPPEVPLSARGDQPGGYFPFHEDPASRIRHHPFHADATKARRASIQCASMEAQQSTLSAPAGNRRTAAAASTNMSRSLFENPHSPEMGTTPTQTPITSYLPSGVNDTAALAMGKYYPSNYENYLRHKQQQQQQQKTRKRAGGDSEGAVAAPLDKKQVPKLRRVRSHAPTESEVKRRLLQYQRDMVTQTSLAATALLNRRGSVVDLSALAASSSLKNLELGAAFLKSHKPLSPRLAPLGSPGPVTPMDLESAPGDSYMTVRRSQYYTSEVSTSYQVEIPQGENQAYPGQKPSQQPQPSVQPPFSL